MSRILAKNEGAQQEEVHGKMMQSISKPQKV